MRDDVEVSVGATPLPAAELRLTKSIKDLPRATLLVDLTAMTADWWSPLEIDIGGNRVFTGSVLSARPERRGVRLEAASAIEMTEVLMGVMSAEDIPTQDVVYAAARGAGFAREHTMIHGLDELPVESIEIVMPLRDVETTEPIDVGQVAILPGADGRTALDAFQEVDDATSAAWTEAPAFALVLRDAGALADAEVEALELIDAALAWLAVRARLGAARLPDGSLLRFDRDSARAAPRQAGVMAVRGLSTGRRWLRDPDRVARREPLNLDRADVHWPPLVSALRVGDRLALLAAREAATALDPVGRAASISTAFEYYSGDASPRPLFDNAELRRLRAELPEWLSDDQRRRAREILGMANSFSLGQRLRAALRRDGVQVTGEEWSALQRVRQIRNRAAHGSEPPQAEADDLEMATSVLSRALTHRMARLGS